MIDRLICMLFTVPAITPQAMYEQTIWWYGRLQCKPIGMCQCELFLAYKCDQFCPTFRSYTGLP